MKLTNKQIQALTDLQERSMDVYRHLGRTYWKGKDQNGKDVRTNLADVSRMVAHLHKWFAENDAFDFGIVKLPLLQTWTERLLDDLIFTSNYPHENNIYNLIMAVSNWNSIMDRWLIDELESLTEVEHA